MNYYSNQDSLETAFGIAEVEGLLGAEDPDARLERAAKAAFDDINAYLQSGGYVLPLLFTPYGKPVPVDGPALLNGRLQTISDDFTAWYLAKGTDLAKKGYNDGRADGLAWLEQVRLSAIRLDLPKTPTPTGSGEAVTVARPRVFNTYMLSENASFPKNP